MCNCITTWRYNTNNPFDYKVMPQQIYTHRVFFSLLEHHAPALRSANVTSFASLASYAESRKVSLSVNVVRFGVIITFRECNKDSPELQQLLKNVALLAEWSQNTGSTLSSFWSYCPEIVEILRQVSFLSASRGRRFVLHSYPLNFSKNKSLVVLC
jgi:hypothetical protein